MYTKKQGINEVKKAWDRIESVLSCVSWGQYGREYYRLNLEEEKQHRGSQRDICGLTVMEAVKLFAVKQIFEYLKGEKPPKVEDYISYRKSIFFAYSLVCTYREELTKALQGVDFENILALDYAELMKV